MEDIVYEALAFLGEKTGIEYDFQTLWKDFGKIAVEKKTYEISDTQERLAKKDYLKSQIKKMFELDFILPKDYIRNTNLSIIHYPDGYLAYFFDKEFDSKNFTYEDYSSLKNEHVIKWLKDRKAKQTTGRNFWRHSSKEKLINFFLLFINRAHLIPHNTDNELLESGLDVSPGSAKSNKRTIEQVDKPLAIVASKTVKNSSYFVVVWENGQITEEAYCFVRDYPILLTTYYRKILVNDSKNPYNTYNDEEFPNVAKFCKSN